MANTEKKVYIVQYDIVDDGDPIKVCKTLDEAKSFVQKLYTEGDDYYGAENIDKGSIRVYESVLIGKPKIEITFSK